MTDSTGTETAHQVKARLFGFKHITRLTEGEQRHVEYFGPKNVYTALERARMNTSSRKIIFEYFGTISKKVIF